MGFRDNDTQGTRYDPPAIGEFTGSYHDTVLGIHDRRPIYGIRPLPDDVVRNMQGAYSPEAISRVVQVQISTGAWINLYRSQVTLYAVPDPEAEAKKRAQEANARRPQTRRQTMSDPTMDDVIAARIARQDERNAIRAAQSVRASTPDERPAALRRFWDLVGLWRGGAQAYRLPDGHSTETASLAVEEWADLA